MSIWSSRKVQIAIGLQPRECEKKGKNPRYLLNFCESLLFLPELENRINHLPQLLKPFILPSWPGYEWFSKAVLSFYFLFILVESLKNDSKSQKNHKIENIIFLDSTWVDLHTKYIIWYTFVQSFYCNFRYMFFYN